MRLDRDGSVMTLPTMSRRMTLLRRRSDVPPAAFGAHWAGPHAEIARRYPGLAKYTQNHVEQRLDPALDDAFRCDGMAELWFPGQGAMHAALGSSVTAELIADEPRFLDGVSGLLLGQADLDDGTGGTKVIVLGRANHAAATGGPAGALHASAARVESTWVRPALWSVPNPPDTVLVGRFIDLPTARAALDPVIWPALAGLGLWHAYHVREVRVV
jgi:uncharacterized protein (TIGR02118 family)